MTEWLGKRERERKKRKGKNGKLNIYVNLGSTQCYVLNDVIQTAGMDILKRAFYL